MRAEEVFLVVLAGEAHSFSDMSNISRINNQLLQGRNDETHAS
jgi:hypothetical protein